jgi:predicted ATPase
MLPSAHVSDTTLAEIYAQSRGNPLFAHDLVDVIHSQAVPSAADGSVPGSPWPAAQLQTRTRALTAMRLALMDDPLRRLLGLAATADDAEISLDQLRAGAAALEPSMAATALLDALDRALQMRLLEERNDGYAFRHPAVRAALYDCLPRHRRDEFRAAHGRSQHGGSRSINRLPGRNLTCVDLSQPQAASVRSGSATLLSSILMPLIFPRKTAGRVLESSPRC